MSDYGRHPTIYGGLSDMHLYSLYRWEDWHRLDEGHRQQLLQETVNRAALKNGENGSCLVVFDDLEKNICGKQASGVITVNRNCYGNDLRETAKNGMLMEEIKVGNNMDALNTVLHEDQHAYQNQIIDGTIPAPYPSLRQEYAANHFMKVNIPQSDGSVKRGLTYIEGYDNTFGYHLYYMQPVERDAHRFSEEQTMRIISMLEKEYGSEPSFDAYRQEIQANGYDATLAEAQELFRNENVEREVNQSLMKYVYGTKGYVSPEINRMVEAEIEKSYEVRFHSSALSQTVSENSQVEHSADLDCFVPAYAEDGLAEEPAAVLENDNDNCITLDDGLYEGGIE